MIKNYKLTIVPIDIDFDTKELELNYIEEIKKAVFEFYKLFNILPSKDVKITVLDLDPVHFSAFDFDYSNKIIVGYMNYGSDYFNSYYGIPPLKYSK